MGNGQDIRSLEAYQEIDFFEGKQSFDNLLKNYHQVKWSKMIVCPCRKDSTTQPVSNCKTCKGFGYFWYDEKDIEGLLSSLAVRNKFIQWTEDLAGTAGFSTLADNRLGWYDKIEVINGVSVFSEFANVEERTVDNQTEKYYFLKYKPIDIIKVIQYVNASSDVIELKVDEDYQMHSTEDFTILIIKNGVTKFSILYTYHPTYLVTDILNDWRAFRMGEKLIGSEEIGADLSKEVFEQYPLRCILKKFHLLLQ